MGLSYATDHKHMDNETIFRLETSSTEPRNVTQRFNDSQGITLLISVLAVLFVLVTVGNVSVLYSTLRIQRKSRMTFFIRNLALADLLVGIFSIFPDLIWKITGQFYGPWWLCKLTKFLMTTGGTGSPFALVVLSIDRFQAIARPFQSLGNYQLRCFLMVGISWTSAVLVNFSTLFIFDIHEVEAYGRQCWARIKEVHFKVYFICVTTFLFFIPAAIIAFCYLGMIYLLTEANRNTRLNESSAWRNRSAGRIPRAKIKTVKMTVVIVSVFICCLLPYITWNYLTLFKIVAVSKSNRIFSVFINQLASLNAVANPIIYWCFTSQRLPCRTTESRPVTASTPPLRKTCQLNNSCSYGELRRMRNTASAEKSNTDTFLTCD